MSMNDDLTHRHTLTLQSTLRHIWPSDQKAPSEFAQVLQRHTTTSYYDLYNI